jgi:DNA polymerase III subunit epsilon
LLRELDVLVLDCQATGATPAHGDLLELGWAVCGGDGLAVAPRAHWIKPRSDRGVSNVVRKLTGWSDDCASVAVDPLAAWALLRSDTSGVSGVAMPTVIHFARFELPFLRALHASASPPSAGEPFPLDTICLHAIAQRLFPDLPRRNLRALAGHLGHSPELVRRAEGHVEASAFIWRALMPVLDDAGVRTWDELKAWLDEPARTPPRPRGKKRSFPLDAERRRALPDAPGVYRFLRPNGDVLYVGKAVSLKKRVASHFTAASRATHERALEMLSQAHDVAITTTATALEAALLETDEIKRIDPPYNVQLRSGERRAWFASRDWRSALPSPDAQHSVGPLPSERAVAGIGAIRALLDGAAADEALRAAALGVPPRWAPEATVFDEGWSALVCDELGGSSSSRARVLSAARRLVVEEREDESDDATPTGWDPEQVRRGLERTIVQEGALIFRAHALCLLSESTILFREPRSTCSRVLIVSGGEIAEQRDAPEGDGPSSSRPVARSARQASFDAARYDRLRVLATELRRIAEHGGTVAVRVGAHLYRS